MGLGSIPREETGQGCYASCTGACLHARNCWVVSRASVARLHLSTRLHRLEKLPCHLVNSRVRGSNSNAGNIGAEGPLL